MGETVVFGRRKNIIIGEAFRKTTRQDLLLKRTNLAGKTYRTKEKPASTKLIELTNLEMETKPEDVIAEIQRPQVIEFSKR